MDGGLGSKNSPNYTSESFLIVNKKDKIHGIKVDVHLTKDKKLIVLDNETMKKIGINETYTNNHTLKSLINLNIGTKVKKNFPISLNALISILDNDKIIIINIVDNNNIDDLTYSISNLFTGIQANNNIYVYGSSMQLIDKIISQNLNVKVGTILNENNEHYATDFHVIDNDLFKSNNARSILNNTPLFIDKVHEKKDFDFINQNYTSNNIYVISKTIC